jgi:hypothetical protein
MPVDPFPEPCYFAQGKETSMRKKIHSQRLHRHASGAAQDGSVSSFLGLA